MTVTCLGWQRTTAARTTSKLGETAIHRSFPAAGGHLPRFQHGFGELLEQPVLPDASYSRTPGIQNSGASFDPLDPIGATQAGFRRKRGYFPGNEISFGFLDFITDPNPAKLEGRGLQDC